MTIVLASPLAVLAGVDDDGSRNPGPLPLLIVALLGLATFLLIKNMSGRLKRLPREFPEQPPADGRAGDERPPTP